MLGEIKEKHLRISQVSPIRANEEFNFEDGSRITSSRERGISCENPIRKVKLDKNNSGITEDVVNLKILASTSNNFEEYFLVVTNTIIEKYEVDLYKIIEVFYETGCEPIKAMQLLLSHAMHNFDKNSDPLGYSDLQSSIIDVVGSNSISTMSYKIIKNLCDFFSALFIKWNIFKKPRYEYRNSRRIEYMRVIEMSKFTSKCLNIETMWFCVAITSNNMKEISTKQLRQYAGLLENQFNKTVAKFLEEHFVCIPSIEDAVGLKSKQYRTLYMSQEPTPFLGENHYQDLKLPSFFKKILRKKTCGKILELVTLVEELEMAYRAFEKELIGRFFLIS